MKRIKGLVEVGRRLRSSEGRLPVSRALERHERRAKERKRR